MTDATPPANGETAGAEPARQANPDPYGTSGDDTAAAEPTTAVAESGSATAWPAWPGVARPAGWFLSASGEAAPPVRFGTEPARADAVQSAADSAMSAASQPAAQPEADVDPQPPTQSGASDRPVTRSQAASRQDGQPKSVRVLDSGRIPEEAAAEDEREPPEVADQDESADSAEAPRSGAGDGWYEDPQPTPVQQVPQAWSWRREPGPGPWQETSYGVPPTREDRGAPGYEPSRSGTWPDAQDAEWQARAYGMPADAAPGVPAVGPTAALLGRAGGPGFVVPPGAGPGIYDPAHRSAWQLAREVWEESGIGWEPPAVEPLPEPGWEPPTAEPLPAPGWGEYRRARSPGQSWPPEGDGREAPPPQAFAVAQDPAWQPHGAPAFAGAPASASSFAGAPTFADASALADAPPPALANRGTSAPSARWPGGEPPDGRGLGESDELYRAWQGSVRQAAARPKMTAARRRQAWQVVRVCVPAVVVVTVGVGAVMMLTGKTNEMLASRANDSSPAPAARHSTVAFAGYPGQRGTVTVNAIAGAGGTRVAVGSADGHPAIWRRAADGTWTLVSALALDQRPGAASLSSVAHGTLGWIAVGDIGSGAAQQPVVVTSSDGVTWRAIGGGALAAPGAFVMAVTAGPSGYVVVGKQVSAGRTFAALWWSADLSTWVAGNNGGLDGQEASSAVYAVSATASGFVAAGTHGGCHTIWTSTDGRNWSDYDVPKPPGASAALLQAVAVNGTRIVTAGYVTGKAGDMPVVVVSKDNGIHWRQILLTAPAGLGSVTALTPAGSGFVAAGEAGPPGAQHAVTWSSPDGETWSAATPVSAGQITALTVTGDTVSGTAQRGAAPSIVTLAAP